MIQDDWVSVALFAFQAGLTDRSSIFQSTRQCAWRPLGGTNSRGGHDASAAAIAGSGRVLGEVPPRGHPRNNATGPGWTAHLVGRFLHDPWDGWIEGWSRTETLGAAA